MRIRQIALVARDLEPAVQSLCDVLGIEISFRDPGVELFGLKNAVMPIGDTFLEVVSPFQEDASAARFLARRGGDGGYMVILQTDDLGTQRRRLTDLGVRIVWETELPDIATIHLHPRDVGGAIVSIDAAVPPESWRWAGPDWESKSRRDVVRSIIAAEIQSPDPAALAERWSRLLDGPVRKDGADWRIDLDASHLTFVPDRDGRGEGLSAIELSAADAERAMAEARTRGFATGERELVLCGTRIRLC